MERALRLLGPRCQVAAAQLLLAVLRRLSGRFTLVRELSKADKDRMAAYKLESEVEAALDKGPTRSTDV